MATHGYARASLSKQHASTDTQKDIIRQYCIANKLIPPEREGLPPQDPYWYVDNATSGKTIMRDREAGGIMVRALRKGDHIVLAKLDRGFRRLSDCAMMMDQFEKIGVSLHVCNLLGGAIDLSKPIGRFMIQILAAFAELERSFISERISDGMQARIRKGLACGWRPRYGFQFSYVMRDGKKERIEIPDPEERKIMKMILAWRVEDPPWAWDQIRQKLNYEMRIRRRSGGEWENNMIRQAAEAETVLQFKELRDGRCHEKSH